MGLTMIRQNFAFKGEHVFAYHAKMTGQKPGESGCDRTSQVDREETFHGKSWGIATGRRIRRNGHPIACSPQNNAVIKCAAVGRREKIANAEFRMRNAKCGSIQGSDERSANAEFRMSKVIRPSQFDISGFVIRTSLFDIPRFVFVYPCALLQSHAFGDLRVMFRKVKNEMLPGDVLPKGGWQSRPVEKFNKERKVAFADGLFQLPERRGLLHFQVRRMADDKVEVAGIVRSSGDPAPVGPNFFLRKISRNEAAQFLQVPGLKWENRVSHVSGATFRRARARPLGSWR
jgi:hypothetical protein